MPTILVEEEIRRLAIGCLHVLYGRAVLNFPTSSRAHPSYWVLVSLGFKGALSEEYALVFPFRVWWKVWQTVIVPVVRRFWGQDLSAMGTFEDLVGVLMAELTNQLRLTGMLPPGPAVEIPDLDGNASSLGGLYGNTWWLRLHFKLEDLPE